MHHDLEHQENIHQLLKDFHGIEPLKDLFWTQLNYNRVNQPISRRGWTDRAFNALTSDPLLFAAGGTDDAFHVVYAPLDSERLLLTAERPVIAHLRRDHPYALFIFSNRTQEDWHFVNVKYDSDDPKKRRLFRRITISPYEKLRTASERIAMLDLESISSELFGLSPLAIQERHDEAFDVEAVTRRFFEDYKAVFGFLQVDLMQQTKDRGWAHDYALQFLNRCMFLYFIQRKRWLGENTEFLRTFWESYQSAKEPSDTFVDRWLKVLFFEAFNRSFHGGHRHFSDEIREALALAPYLNGGLFTENQLDQPNHDFIITDGRFSQVFDFLEGYNFTIAEDSPLDQEVAVDPEMIGKVYESLVNVSTEADERGDAGIFYTPRTEIDMMCRLALVDHLTNQLGEDHKDLLYEVIFAFEPDDKADADQRVAATDLWKPLDASLKEFAVVDPACGSGSFLVGMLYILDDLRNRANQQLDREESGFDRKKGIIGQSLYGVDVMEWACHVAELRLWLALIIDAEFSRAELHVRKDPLLPHFSFNIRCGDSLVQEIGGMNLSQIRADFSGVPRDLKARVPRLKNEKLKFYSNDTTCQYRSVGELQHAELQLFRDLLNNRADTIEAEINSLRQRIEAPSARQMRFDGTVEGDDARQLGFEVIEWQKQIEALTADLERLTEARNALKTAKDVPFVWDIAFVEIFTGEKGGFDIVIGNPPYVRQENISDPRTPREKVTTANKKAYKAKLARSVYQAFPRFFGYQRKKDTKPEKPESGVTHKLDAKSDLYIYFYFRGLSLLNPKGSFCFITSNSWLDVGYGKDLQEFTLKHCHVKQIIDNQARRSFADADVNTVIVFFSSPNEKREWGLDQTSRFVMFKVPFEHILDPIIFEEVEEAKERRSTPEYQIYPIRQQDLLEAGCELPKTDAKQRRMSKPAKYTGDKWGGKYLRAPDIYWTILEKGKDKIISIEPAVGEVVTVSWSRQGRNKEIMVSKDRITKETTIPVLKSPREFDGIVIKSSDVKTHLRIGLIDERQVVRTPLVWDDIRGERHICRLNSDMLGFTHNFHGIYLYNGNSDWQICACLNSTLTWLFIETLGRRGLGGGGVRILVEDLKRTPLIIRPDCFSLEQIQSLQSAFTNLTCRPVYNVSAEITKNMSDVFNVNPDRRALDTIIFDVLDLTRAEREAVYEAVIMLVEARIKKANSL